MNCQITGCGKAAKARGLCNTHYERRRLGFDNWDSLDDLRVINKRLTICSVSECDTRVADTESGLCGKHRYRQRRHGSTSDDAVRQRSGRRIGDNGYVYLFQPDHPLAMAHGYVAEHRAVAFAAGLLDEPAMHVHHVNGDKTDNRLENLDVLSPSEHAALHHSKGS